jgi:hypothetical protein
MQGRLCDISLNVTNRKQKITIEIDEDFRGRYDELKDRELEVTVKPYRKSRTLDQNSLLWAVIGKIADKLRANKDDIYLMMLKRYGQGGVIKVSPKNEEAILSALKYYERHEKLYNDTDKYYRIWAGSSGYNTEEFSVLLEGTISEAKGIGIELTSLEQQSLLAFVEELEKSRSKREVQEN